MIQGTYIKLLLEHLNDCMNISCVHNLATVQLKVLSRGTWYIMMVA